MLMARNVHCCSNTDRQFSPKKYIYLNDNKQNSLHLMKKKAQIFVLGHLSENHLLFEQIMSADKYLNISLRPVEAIVYLCISC